MHDQNTIDKSTAGSWLHSMKLFPVCYRFSSQCPREPSHYSQESINFNSLSICIVVSEGIKAVWNLWIIIASKSTWVVVINLIVLE